MKRNILAVLIPGLLAIGAVNAAEIYNQDGNKLNLYGKVDARHQFSSNKSADGDKTYARLGIKGVTQINSELSGYGQWEYNINTNNSETTDAKNATRLAFAGLKYADYGSFDYGRNYGVIYDVESYTDVLPVFGGDSYTNTDNFMTGRANNLATYRNTDFFGIVEGLDFALQYQGKNGGTGESANPRTSIAEQNGEGIGLATQYNIGMGLSIAVAYADSHRTAAQKRVILGKKAEAWTTGIKYDANNIYLAAIYAGTRNMTPYGDYSSPATSKIAKKTENVELVAQYQFDFGLRPSIAYLQSKGKHLAEGSHNLVKYVALGSYYDFNKNMTTYIDYKVNLLKKNKFTTDNNITTDNIVGVGMTYQF